MKAIRFVIISFLIISVLSNCTISQSNKTDQTLIDEEKITGENKLIEEDFNITYKGVVINDRIPFKEIVEKLGITIGANADNTDTKASSNVEGVNYDWYVLHYPSKENEDIRIQYVVNETDGTLTLVSIDLFNKEATTYRDITVGDDLKKLVKAYGSKNEPHYKDLSRKLCNLLI